MPQTTDYIPISLVVEVIAHSQGICIVLDDGVQYITSTFTIDANGMHGDFTEEVS